MHSLKHDQSHRSVPLPYSLGGLLCVWWPMGISLEKLPQINKKKTEKQKLALKISNALVVHGRNQSSLLVLSLLITKDNKTKQTNKQETKKLEIAIYHVL